MVFHILKSLEDTAPTRANRVTLLHTGWAGGACNKVCRRFFKVVTSICQCWFMCLSKFFHVFLEISAHRANLLPTGWRGEVSATPIYPAAAPPAPATMTLQNEQKRAQCAAGILAA